MNRKQIIQRIGHLEDQHKEKMIDGEYCRGCEICEEITKLSVYVKHSPKVAEILEKSDRMKKSEIQYLIDKEVNIEVIAKALNKDPEAFKEEWKMWKGSKIKQRKDRSTIKMTVDEYLKLSDSGLMDKEIAEKIGVSRQTITNWKIKHKNELPREDVDKVELTKENYIGWKKQGLKDIEITKLIKKNTNYLKDWKKENLTQEEIRTLNLPRGHFAKKTNKSLQKENKPQKSKSGKKQTLAEMELQDTINYLKTELLREQERHSISIQKLNEKAEKGREGFEKKINDLINKLEAEKEGKEKLIKNHNSIIQSYIDEKDLAYGKAQEEEQKYLDTLDKLKETDYKLQDALQRIKEVESERDQYKMHYAEQNKLLHPMASLLIPLLQEAL